ncbi:MAG: class I SAM-dependent DNA methyltransferase [Terriglobales bacterium]
MSHLEPVEELNTPQPVPRSKSFGGYDPAFFQQLARVEDRHFWFQARNHLISRMSRKLVSELAPGYWVLEVGCGTGNVLRALRQACPDGTVVGLELWLDGLRFAQKRSVGPLVQGDVRRCPFGKPFDLIGMFDVLEHVPEELETLRALREALAPGGRLMLTVPAHQSLWSYFDEAAQHCRRYSSPEIRAQLVAAGFDVEFLSQFMSCIFPLVWLFRKMSSWNRRPGSANAKALTLREFRVVPVMNGLLSALLKLETPWLTGGHRLPVGTSLIVVARRK